MVCMVELSSIICLQPERHKAGEGRQMKMVGIGVLLISLVSVALAVEDVVNSTHGTITKIDKAAKTIVVKTADGTEHIFQLSGHAAADGAKDIAAGAEKGTKVTVYSTGEASKKVAHFFEKI